MIVKLAGLADPTGTRIEPGAPTLAVDPLTDDLYADRGDVIAQYDSAANLLGTSGAGQLSGESRGVAVGAAGIYAGTAPAARSTSSTPPPLSPPTPGAKQPPRSKEPPPPCTPRSAPPAGRRRAANSSTPPKPPSTPKASRAPARHSALPQAPSPAPRAKRSKPKSAASPSPPPTASESSQATKTAPPPARRSALKPSVPSTCRPARPPTSPKRRDVERDDQSRRGRTRRMPLRIRRKHRTRPNHPLRREPGDDRHRYRTRPRPRRPHRSGPQHHLPLPNRRHQLLRDQQRAPRTLHQPPGRQPANARSHQPRQTGATLNATINPEGVELEECRFEYGESEGLGQSIPCAESPATIGTGTEPVPVHADLTGLDPNTTYHFRIAATNSFGTSKGAEKSLETHGPPTIAAESATAITTTAAKISGLIDPHGEATSFQVQYLTEAAYEANEPSDRFAGATSVPVPAEEIGLGTGPLAVAQQLTGLVPRHHLPLPNRRDQPRRGSRWSRPALHHLWHRLRPARRTRL